MPGVDTTKDNIFLIWGGRSWVASHLATLLRSQGRNVCMTTVLMEHREQVQKELARLKPTHVFNCAGVTGRPNVDWCEDHKQETLTSNLVGTINLAVCCAALGVHLTVFATGCIYAYDKDHPEGGRGYTETDSANFEGSFYSLTKAVAENYMKQLPCLILRLRMPVSDDLHPRSFVTKITKYDHVVDIENSNSILHDLLPAAVLLADHRDLGVYNFTNPGAISHNEVLALFQKIVRPDFSWKNFSVEEQSKILKAGRSNCKLDTTKLIDKMREYNYEIPEVHDAYKACFRRMVSVEANKANVKAVEVNGGVTQQPVKSTSKRKRVDEEEVTAPKAVKVS